MRQKVTSDLYWAYGLSIESEIPLSDLVASQSSKADVRIRYLELPDSLISDSITQPEVFERPGCRILVDENAMCIEWDRVGRFLVREGREVLVDADADATEEDLQPFLTGPILAVLLHQRGSFVLHSSSVVIDGGAVVFLGNKGDGKSTLAAHLQVRGHQLISDDLVPIGFEGSSVITSPGFPRVKLFDDSIVAAGEQPSDFPVIHRFVDKRSFRFAETFPTAPYKIRAIYVLSEAEAVGLEELNPTTAFIEVTKNSFLNRFLAAMNSQRSHFEQCHRLVTSVPVRKLSRPHNFAAMDEVCSLLQEDAGRIAVTSR